MLVWILLAGVSGLAAQTLEQKIDALASQFPAMARAHWGAHAVALETGRSVYARNAESFFVPASNTKLFSTALALRRLGGAHRLVTRVVAAGPPDATGTVSGDLVLAGGGDPTLSAREIPYRKGPVTGDPLAALEALAEQALQKGVRRVKGDVVGDDSVYVWDPYPAGWTVDDTLWEYGAPVSALVLHDNSIRVDVRPGARAGDAARVALWPALGYFTVDSRARTVPAGTAQRLFVERGPGTRQVRIWGEAAVGQGTTWQLAVDDPARYAAFALREALTRRGVAVEGGVSVRHRYPGGVVAAKESTELARRESPPLVELLKIVNKVSQNLHAELVLREVARTQGKPPTRRAALEELERFLEEAGIRKGDFHFEDGSGLSRRTLVTPAAVTALLRYMHAGTDSGLWMDLLPVGGEDGTLSGRFQGLPGGRVLAKTGTIRGVTALAGYVQNRRGQWIAFSAMVNNANSPAAEPRQFIDKIVLLLIEEQ